MTKEKGQRQGLEVGEPYFRASLDAEKLYGMAARAIQQGNKNVYLSLFPNKGKQGDDDPALYAGGRVGAVWKKTKKSEEEKQKLKQRQDSDGSVDPTVDDL